ncbi:MAG: CBS domain-containing protein [Myxococcales bacterium]|nr:CBS domain-containing protein [Myxococcales bacterium]MDD9970842.1 CBS domain-containing protein [Myxococcales bacterium]
MRTVRDLMQTNVVTVRPDDNAAEVERRLVEHRIGGAPVVGDGRVQGVISRTDLLRNLVVGQSLSELISDYYRDPGLPVEAGIPAPDIEQLQRSRVRDLMPERLITVEPSAPVSQAARVMLDRMIHRLLVVEGEKLVGVVTTHDLLRAIAE